MLRFEVAVSSVCHGFIQDAVSAGTQSCLVFENVSKTIVEVEISRNEDEWVCFNGVQFSNAQMLQWCLKVDTNEQRWTQSDKTHA